MAKKVLAASGVSLFMFLAIMVFFWITAESLTDVGAQTELPEDYQATEELEQAEKYKENGDYEQAEAIYQTIIADYPATIDALRAQEKLAILYVVWAKQAEADAALDELVANFSEYEQIVKAIDHVADKYRQKEYYERAGELYQYIADQWPNAEHVMDSAAAAALSNVLLLIHTGDEAGAQQALEDLIADFSDYQNIAKVVDNVADEYRGMRNYERASELYQYVVDQWPDAEHASESQMGAELSGALHSIELGDNTSVQQTIDDLIADFNGHPSLTRMVFQIGERYYNNASWYENEGLELEAGDSLANAVAVWERIISECSPSANATRAYYFSARGYESLGEYEYAIQYYEKVAADWPDYRYAWNALFMVGRNYEILKESGAVAKSEADAKTKAAYEQVLEKYPDCKAARHAQRWLSRHNSQ